MTLFFKTEYLFNSGRMSKPFIPKRRLKTLQYGSEQLSRLMEIITVFWHMFMQTVGEFKSLATNSTPFIKDKKAIRNSLTSIAYCSFRNVSILDTLNEENEKSSISGLNRGGVPPTNRLYP